MNRRDFLNRSASAGLVASTPISSLFGRDLSAGDLEIVRQAIRLHPGALRYLDHDALEDAFGQLRDGWEANATLAERFLALSGFLAKLRCGHTKCNPYNQSASVRRDLFDRPTRLPFLFRWIDEQMIVTRDLTGSGRLQPGTRIDRIDRRGPEEILARLLPLASADGANDGKRIAELEVRGGQEHYPFDLYQGLLFPPARDGRFAVEWTGPDGEAYRGNLAASTASQRLAAAPPPGQDGGAIWTLQEREDGIAVLTMPTWAIWPGGWDWAAWLMEQAPRLYASRGVVIDIRGNEGGISCGNPILARLSATDIPLDFYRRLVRFREVPAALEPFITFPYDGFRRLGVDMDAVGNGFYGDTDPEPDIIAAARPQLTVPTAILTDAANSSATFLFAQTIERHGLARLFGQETGGNLRGINAGAVGFVHLPESGLEFDLPLMGYFPEGDRPDRGVLPDVAVSTSAVDIAAGRDPVLDAASAWIASRE